MGAGGLHVVRRQGRVALPDDAEGGVADVEGDGAGGEPQDGDVGEGGRRRQFGQAQPVLVEAADVGGGGAGREQINVMRGELHCGVSLRAMTNTQDPRASSRRL